MKRSLALSLAVLSTAPLAAQQRPEARPLGPVVATSGEQFGATVFVRHLKSGVVVNDPFGRRLVKLDDALANPQVIADSTPATANAYSGRSGSLVAYRGDSSLFIDAQSLSMLVIDPDGKVGRVMSVPRSQDAMVLGNTMIGNTTYDGAGKLVYRSFGMPRFEMRGGPGGGGLASPPQMPDTAAIVRVDLATRQVDTIAWIKIPRIKMDIQRDEATGNIRAQGIMNPLPTIDEWAVLTDGSIAVVRGRDYHVEFIRPDGKREAAAKVPFDWQRLTDEDKVAFIDSLKAARERMVAAQPAPAPTVSSNTVTTPGGGQQRTEMIVMGGGPMGGAGGAGGNPLANMGRNMQFVPPEELPDYKPPFFTGAVRPDGDGNLWVLTIPTKAIAGGPVYDVVNAKGELVERVQIPKDRTIVGFGAGGFVYLAVREGGKTKLEKARVR
jgi:hypothetical protein